MRTILAALVILAGISQSAHAADYYGAIAVSPSTLALGWGYDYRSRGAAERNALNHCAENAGDCQVAIWFRNACGALASGNGGGWGAAWGATRNAAVQNALNECSRHTSNCASKRWVCTQR